MANPLPINPDEVYRLAQIGCKNDEIAAWFGCSTDTIERRFAAELIKGKSELKMSLRRWQLKSASAGNVVMQIWLGKQMLGQIDRSQIDISKIPDEIFIEEAKRRLSGAGEDLREAN